MARKITYEKGKPYPLGITEFNGDIGFSVIIPGDSQVKLYIYKKNYSKPVIVIPFDENLRCGNIGTVVVKGLSYQDIQYCYEIDGILKPDRYAVSISNMNKFGKNINFDGKRSQFLENFDWEDDKRPYIPMGEIILYKLHVRGFSKHSSSKTKCKGTFRAIEEKIPYFNELGINQLEFMPIYEFIDTINSSKPFFGKNIDAVNLPDSVLEKEFKCNYWGYAEENRYMCVKSAYAYGSDASVELKHLIKLLHSNNIEVVLQFYFTERESSHFIIDCLRFWVYEYHIDGIRIMGNTDYIDVIRRDALFSDIKIYSDYMGEHSDEATNHLAVTNEQYKQTIRAFLKSDMCRSEEAAYLMRKNGIKINCVNYICNHDGFTMYDMVSYEQKHNELNGENNFDGTDYNFSWNCGAEGRTRKSKIMSLRKQQMRNAWFMLMFSRGIPAILAGDELCNSQNGNNNAYCQDNSVGWVNWNTPKALEDILDYVKNLIKIRKKYNKIWSCYDSNIMYDENRFPIVSYHGDKAWNMQFRPSDRHFGVMYTSTPEPKQQIIFLAYNMNWIPQQFGLPKLSKKMNWYVVVDTSEDNIEDEYKKIYSPKIVVKERSCVLLVAR